MRAPGEPERALEVLDAATCGQLLRGEAIGRIAVARPGQGPLVVPVTYVVEDQGNITFRSAEGTKLDALRRGRASLQVDGIDPVHRTGWSVLVDGWVRLDDAGDRAPASWLPGPLPAQVTLVPVTITGRAIVLRQPETDPRGYR